MLMWQLFKATLTPFPPIKSKVYTVELNFDYSRDRILVLTFRVAIEPLFRQEFLQGERIYRRYKKLLR
jgi:hypothetical protein